MPDPASKDHPQTVGVELAIVLRYCTSQELTAGSSASLYVLLHGLQALFAYSGDMVGFSAISRLDGNSQAQAFKFTNSLGISGKYR